MTDPSSKVLLAQQTVESDGILTALDVVNPTSATPTTSGLPATAPTLRGIAWPGGQPFLYFILPASLGGTSPEFAVSGGIWILASSVFHGAPSAAYVGLNLTEGVLMLNPQVGSHN
jgi:hypothetical protein